MFIKRNGKPAGGNGVAYKIPTLIPVQEKRWKRFFGGAGTSMAQQKSLLHLRVMISRVLFFNFVILLSNRSVECTRTKQTHMHARPSSSPNKILTSEFE